MPISSSSNPESEMEQSVEKTAVNTRFQDRRIIFLVVAIPLIGIMSLFIWGVTQAEGVAGRPGVNSSLGEVDVEPILATDFEIQLYTGESLRLSDLRGKVVMVDFWSSWCPPCRAEAPTLAQAYLDYQGMPVEFIGIDVWDTEKGARDYMERYGVTFPTGADPEGRISVEYGLTGIPEKYFIDGNGVIRQKYVGPMDSETLTNLLDEYLTELETSQLLESLLVE